MAFIGDIVGRPGRYMVKHHINHIKEKFAVDLVIVNSENISHGFGMTIKNAKEMFSCGIDLMTGGNHSWDKREVISLLESEPILRPINFPKSAPGKGIGFLEIGGEKLAVINLMGYFTMPMVDNPFTMIKEEIEKLKVQNCKNIFIDMHAEATSEKRALLMILKGQVSAICGTHTHIGTDDLVIDEDTFYVSDVGLTGCRDGVIGMDAKEPMERFLTSISSKFDVPKSCKKILQAVIFELQDGKCTEAFKIKAYDEAELEVSQRAYIEQ